MQQKRQLWLPFDVIAVDGFYYFATSYPFKLAKPAAPVNL